MKPVTRDVVTELTKLLEPQLFNGDYMETCRQDPMNRIFVQGDWYVIYELHDDLPDTWIVKGPKCWGPYRHAYHTLTTERTQIVWLPRLDQIVDMLYEKRLISLTFGRRGEEDFMCVISPSRTSNTLGRSKEESAYRMLLQLTLDKSVRA